MAKKEIYSSLNIRQLCIHYITSLSLFFRILFYLYCHWKFSEREENLQYSMFIRYQYHLKMRLTISSTYVFNLQLRKWWYSATLCLCSSDVDGNGVQLDVWNQRHADGNEVCHSSGREHLPKREKSFKTKFWGSTWYNVGVRYLSQQWEYVRTDLDSKRKTNRPGSQCHRNQEKRMYQKS